MRSVLRTAHGLRLAALIALGAFGLHQLRYLIDGGAHSLAGEEHSYMTGLFPAIAVLVLAATLATLIRGTEGASPARAPITRRTAFFAFALLAVYAGQESVEGILASGHFGGLAAVFGGDGWLAVPLALGIAALLSVMARALEGVERAIALAHDQRARTRAPAVRGRALPGRGFRLTTSPLAFGLARRPPPAPAT
jgi:hypothetical protein